MNKIITMALAGCIFWLSVGSAGAQCAESIVWPPKDKCVTQSEIEWLRDLEYYRWDHNLLGAINVPGGKMTYVPKAEIDKYGTDHLKAIDILFRLTVRPGICLRQLGQ